MNNYLELGGVVAFMLGLLLSFNLRDVTAQTAQGEPLEVILYFVDLDREPLRGKLLYFDETRDLYLIETTDGRHEVPRSETSEIQPAPPSGGRHEAADARPVVVTVRFHDVLRTPLVARLIGYDETSQSFVLEDVDGSTRRIAWSDVLRIVPLTEADAVLKEFSIRVRERALSPFDDPNLEAAIREALRLPDGPVRDVDLRLLTVLNASARGIQRLDGIERCSNLERLNLSSLHVPIAFENRIESYKPLTGLPRLDSLDLGGHEWLDDDDLRVISSIDQLAVIHFSSALVTDAGIEHLKNLNSLRSLSVENASFTNSALSTIADFEELKDLRLVHCPNIDDHGIAQLVTLRGLQSINLAGSLGITNEGLEIIAAMPNLRSMTVGDMQRVNDRSLEILSGVQGLQDLRILGLTNVTSRGLSFLEDAASLRNLRLNGSFNSITLSDIRSLRSALPGCKVIAGRFEDENLAESIREALGKPDKILIPEDLGGLRRLDARSKGIRYLNGFAGASTLEHLDLGHDDSRPEELRNRIDNLWPLFALTALEYLDLDGNDVENIQHLANLPSLSDLTLSRNPVRDLSALAALPNLERLNLSGCEYIVDSALEPLRTVGRLAFLDVTGTSVSQDGIASLRQALPNCRITLSPFEDLQLAKAVHDTLGIAPGALSLNDLMALIELHAEARGIHSLAGLENCPNITHLELGSRDAEEYLRNKIGALSQLKDLKSLKHLGLSGIVELGDNALRVVGSLPSLESLNISSGPRITDLGFAPLGALQNLRYLYVGETQISSESLRLIASFSDLLSLEISSCPNIDDSGLAHLAALKNLRNVNANRSVGLTTKGIAHLAGIQTLQSLTLGGEDLKSAKAYILDDGLLETLSRCQNLESLRLIPPSKFTPKGLDFLRKLDSLRLLVFWGDFSENFTPADINRLRTAIPQCTISVSFLEDVNLDRVVLETLDIQDRFLSRVDYKNVNKLDARSRAIRDVDGLYKCTNLVTLDLGNDPSLPDATRNRDLNMRGFEFARLEELDVSNTDLADASLLPSARELRQLDLSKNPLRWLSPLTGFTKLERLNLRGCKNVDDRELEYLKAIGRLESLDLRGTGVTPIAVEDLRLALPSCQISWEGAIVSALKKSVEELELLQSQGEATRLDVARMKLKLEEARIEEAEGRNQHDDVVEYLKNLVTLLESVAEDLRLRVELGLSSRSEYSDAQVSVLQGKARLADAESRLE